MNIKQQINGLLGPLEAAARQDSLEDVADIANEIARLARAGVALEDKRKATIQRQLDAALVQSEALRPVPQAERFNVYPKGRWSTI